MSILYVHSLYTVYVWWSMCTEHACMGICNMHQLVCMHKMYTYSCLQICFYCLVLLSLFCYWYMLLCFNNYFYYCLIYLFYCLLKHFVAAVLKSAIQINILLLSKGLQHSKKRLSDSTQQLFSHIIKCCEWGYLLPIGQPSHSTHISVRSF